MDKKLLKTREDFIEWKSYCKGVVYDYVYFMAEEEDEPKASTMGPKNSKINK